MKKMAFSAVLMLVVQSFPSQAMPPAVPPPPEAKMRVVLEVIATHPIGEAMKSSADSAITTIAWAALYEANVKTDLKAVQKHELLKTRLHSKLPQNMEPIHMAARRCLGTGLAVDLSLTELEDFRRFAITPAGRKVVWQLFPPVTIGECYLTAISENGIRVTTADFNAIGVSPPKSYRLNRRQNADLVN
jgi:hypothetical protein